MAAGKGIPRFGRTGNDTPNIGGTEKRISHNGGTGKRIANIGRTEKGIPNNGGAGTGIRNIGGTGRGIPNLGWTENRITLGQESVFPILVGYERVSQYLWDMDGTAQYW